LRAGSVLPLTDLGYVIGDKEIARGSARLWGRGMGRRRAQADAGSEELTSSVYMRAVGN
jgi:hypothetical protein